MPKSIPYKYVGLDRVNNFHVIPVAKRRLVSESFRAGSRNHKVPTTSNPIMLMCHDNKSSETTEARLNSFKLKNDFILQK